MYFGHMLELYAFWAMVPFFIADIGQGIEANATYFTASLAFLAGAIGCMLGGVMSHRWGSGRVAIVALMGSAGMCLVYPFLHELTYGLAIGGLLVWGFFVVADSAQFSALVTEVAPRHGVGTALTLQTSLGFLLSVATIQLVPALVAAWGWPWAFPLLALGPAAGIDRPPGLAIPDATGRRIRGAAG